jgi:PKD repeat protein
LSFDAYLKFIEDRFLGGQRLDPATDGRPDPRPTVRENVQVLGDLTSEFDFARPPRAPLIIPPTGGPIIGPTPTVSPTAPLTVSFDGSASLDSDGDISSWKLRFGDGTRALTGTGPPPMSTADHTYPSAGSYRPSLTVTDSTGLSNTASTVVDVGPSPPDPSLTAYPAFGGPAPFTVRFDGSESTDLDDDVVSWKLTFGDGTPRVSGTGSPPPLAPTHIYTAPGRYKAQLTVTDAGGLARATYVTVVVTEPLARPEVLTTKATRPTAHTVYARGTVNPHGQDTTYYFAWGSAKDNYTSTTAVKSAGSGSTSVFVSETLTGLDPSTTYHFRLFATNASGTSKSSDRAFTTAGPPIAATGDATAVGTGSASLSAAINPDGLFTTWEFQYGPTASYGLATPTGSLASGYVTSTVTSTLAALSAGTTYHYRIVATNSAGTTLGEDRSFTT